MKLTRNEQQKQLLNKYEVNSSGIYVVSPRFGKTALAINIIKKNKAKSILWVTPSAKLRDEDVPEEFNKWTAKSYLKKTNIITYDMLHKEEGYYDVIILDEIQHLGENRAVNLLLGTLKYKSLIGLTGTLSKHQDKLDLLKQLKLNVLADITIDDAVENDYIADYTINVVECNLDSVNKNIEAGAKGKKFKTTEAAQYNYLTKNVNIALFSNNANLKKFAILNRMRSIYNSPTKENIAKYLINNLQGRKLVFAGSIKQAETLSKTTYHSKTNKNNLNKFLNEEIDLLACVNAGGTGFTYTNVDHFIIVQSDSNKNGQTTQKLSRSLLKQTNYKANVWIICLLNTKDVDWVNKALQDFDSKKINYINSKNL